MSLNNLVKRLQDIMRNDAGINGDAQRIEQMVWILFLKVYDAKEEIWEFYNDDYTQIVRHPFRHLSIQVQNTLLFSLLKKHLACRRQQIYSVRWLEFVAMTSFPVSQMAVHRRYSALHHPTSHNENYPV